MPSHFEYSLCCLLRSCQTQKPPRRHDCFTHFFSESILSHRLHLTSTPTFDFGITPNYNYTGLAQNKFIIPGYTCLYAGDFDANGVIKFSNPGDDANTLTTDVLTYPTNTLFVSNYNAAFGYLAGDYNMDGKAKLDNPNDDQSLLLSQIFLYPINVGIVYNFGV